MKLLSKAIAFVKENKIITFAFAVVILSFVFLALPGQFVRYGIGLQIKENKFEWTYKLSGYQFIFNTMKDSSGEKIGAKVVGQGIAIIVLLVACIPGLLFSKKTSFFTLVTGIALVVVSILFFTISKAGHKCYNGGIEFITPEINDKSISLMKWVPYVTGSLLVIAGGLVIYKAVMMMKDEVKHPTQSTKGPSYNYLHK